ncbi:MAG: TonB family protein [Pseudomonadota bacterium]
MPAYIPFSFGRLIVGLPVAAGVTVGLFLVMSGIIAQGDAPEEVEPVFIPSINAKIPRSPGTDTPPTGPATDISDPPPPITPDRQGRERPNPNKFDDFKPSRGDSSGGGDDIRLDQALIPIIRIEPVYPNGCARRGVEGMVTVEFDVSPQGAVLNPRIISSADRCFERATLQAVRKWKYSPTGRTTQNVRTNLTFRLGG